MFDSEFVFGDLNWSAPATEVYNSLVTFRKTMVEWSGISEGRFMQARRVAEFQTI